MSSDATTSTSEVALDKLFELAGRLSELMNRHLAERGLSPARAEVLLVLHVGGPVVQRQLSQALRCTPRHVTTLVDALEAEGLVQRRPHPRDRRATCVSLTAKGGALAAKMVSDRREGARALLGDVASADLAIFVTIADQVLDRIGGASEPAGVEAASSQDQPHGVPLSRGGKRGRP